VVPVSSCVVGIDLEDEVGKAVNSQLEITDGGILIMLSSICGLEDQLEQPLLIAITSDQMM